MNLEPIYAEGVNFLESKKQVSHHVINCTVRIDGKDIPAVAKKNKHNEAKTIHELSQTVIQPVIPNYYGLYEKDGIQYFIMEDLNAGFTSPCLTDLKLGTRAWDLRFRKEVKKKLQAYAQQSTSGIYGVRFISNVTRKNGKVVGGVYVQEGLTMSYPEFAEKLIWCLPKQHLRYIFRYIVYIRKLFDHLYRDLPAFRMYAGSLIINFDGDQPDLKPRLTILDFAHTHIDIDHDGGDSDLTRFDDNILRGLDTLIAIIGLHLPPIIKIVRHGSSSSSDDGGEEEEDNHEEENNSENTNNHEAEKQEHQDETPDEIKDETQDKIKDEAQDEIKDETQDKIKDETQDEIKDETQDKIKDETKGETKDDIHEMKEKLDEVKDANVFKEKSGEDTSQEATNNKN
ncbi:hypothetical protein TRFO_01487 [Tritrichomonas foetus]|uniref:Kinase n=1 Tax=Tritrichomonas foetus TaxID=1144522 RepID=A0A1J4JXT0_9EUKA|nr:hypothetical protein TRFO_01487 [Tritrichomonas foetus]|eukprot:OHT03803.1 hypothetical protein TRFO_01487 [Tritrichomonas foetus]